MRRALVPLIRRLLPAGVRRHRILGGPLRGCHIHASWRNYPRAILGRAEPELLAWLADRVEPGETWLDVGAHYGYTALALARGAGPGGRVFAFEPVLETAGHLASTRAANALTHLVVVPMALGAEPALTLVRSATTFRGMAQMTQAGPGDDAVYSIAFDRIWPSLHGGDSRVHGVKVDVQGLEATVVRGMAETLRRDRPRLVVEYHAYAPLDDLLAALADAGYRPEGDPVERAGAGGSRRYVHACSYEFRPV